MSGRFSNYFVEMILRWPSIRFLSKNMAARGRGFFALCRCSKKSSPPKVLGRFSNNFVEIVLGWPLSDSFKPRRLLENNYGHKAGLFRLIQLKWKSSPPKYRDVTWVTFYQIPSSHVVWLKDLAARGQGCFALYGYSENLKIFLDESIWPIFK